MQVCSSCMLHAACCGMKLWSVRKHMKRYLLLAILVWRPLQGVTRTSSMKEEKSGGRDGGAPVSPDLKQMVKSKSNQSFSCGMTFWKGSQGCRFVM